MTATPLSDVHRGWVGIFIRRRKWQQKAAKWRPRSSLTLPAPAGRYLCRSIKTTSFSWESTSSILNVLGINCTMHYTLAHACQVSSLGPVQTAINSCRGWPISAGATLTLKPGQQTWKERSRFLSASGQTRMGRSTFFAACSNILFCTATSDVN